MATVIEKNKTHKELVEIAYSWLLRTKPRNTMEQYGACRIAFKEKVSHCTEIPDVIGFRSSCSILIECKASRSDFLSDKNKHFRVQQDLGMGDYRYYICNNGIVKTDECGKWGLLEISSTGNQIRIIKDSEKFESNLRNERTFLTSMWSRICHIDLLDIFNDQKYKTPYDILDSDIIGITQAEKTE